MSYACPYKGTEKAVKQCARDAESVRGWKKHMSRQHGQYSESELAAIVGAQPIDPERGKSLFLAEMGGQTDTPGQGATEEKLRDGAETLKPDGTAPEPKTKVVPLKMKKLKKALSSLPKQFLKAKGVTPDADDMEIIDGAEEILEEMFGVSLEVPESAFVIRSRLLALLFPLGAMLLVWLKHEFKLKLLVTDANAKPNGDANPKSEDQHV